MLKIKKSWNFSSNNSEVRPNFFLESVYNMTKGTKNKIILQNESEADIVVSMFVQLHWQMFVSYLFKNVQNVPEGTASV
jgi:hypothetical protein